MPTRKRKSAAVIGASPDAGVEGQSSSPNTTRRKRTKHTAASSSQQDQQDQAVQEQASPENPHTEVRDVQLEETVKASASKKSPKKGKAVSAVSIEKPRTPNESVSPDANHPPIDTPSPEAMVNVLTLRQQREGPHSSAGATDTRLRTSVGSLGSTSVGAAETPQFSPLRTILGERISRLFSPSSTPASTGTSTGERGQLRLTESADVNMTNGINLSARSILVEPNAVVVQPDPTAELEVQRFEEVTSSLNKDLGSVRATLQILVTELQTLGFADTDATSDVVLASVRAAFREARAHLNELMPEVDANSYQNGDLLKLLTTNISDMLATLAEYKELISNAEFVEQALIAQNNGLLDRLAEGDQRKHELQSTLQKTDILADKRAREILQLEDNIRKLRDKGEEQESALEERDAAIEELNEDLADAYGAADGLRVDLQETLEVLERTKTMVTDIERDHQQRLSEAERKHAADVKYFQHELSLEVSAHLMIQRNGEIKNAHIEDLETKVRELTNDINVMRDRLAASNEETKLQVQKCSDVETTLNERQFLAEQLEGRLEEAEERLAALNEELNVVRARAGSERHQREAAEAELDALNTEVESLTSRLHEAGKEANELKSKLFEVQQLRESEVKAVKANVFEEMHNLEEELASEQEARTNAEQKVAELADVVLPELEARLQVVEFTSARCQALKDEALLEKHRLIDSLQTEGVERDVRHTEFITAKTQEVQSLRDEIDRLVATITARESALAVLKVDVAKLQKDKASLEARVESEAVALLEAQDVHANSIAALNSAIKTRDVEIGKLLQQGHAAGLEHENTLAVRAGQIRDLEELVESKEVEIETLSQHVGELHERLMKSVQLGRDVVGKVSAAHAAAHDASLQAEQKFLHDADALVGDGDGDVVTISQTSVQQSKGATRQRRSLRVMEQVNVKAHANHDSGLFEASNGTEGVILDTEQVEAA